MPAKLSVAAAALAALAAAQANSVASKNGSKMLDRIVSADSRAHFRSTRNSNKAHDEVYRLRECDLHDPNMPKAVRGFLCYFH